MSFDVNIGRSEPVIKAASNMNNDGGSGGNLGYMMRGRKQKKEENGSLFSNQNATDTFEFSSGFVIKEPEYQEENKTSWVKSLLNKLGK